MLGVPTATLRNVGTEADTDVTVSEARLDVILRKRVARRLLAKRVPLRGALTCASTSSTGSSPEQSSTVGGKDYER